MVVSPPSKKEGVCSKYGGTRFLRLFGKVNSSMLERTFWLLVKPQIKEKKGSFCSTYGKIYVPTFGYGHELWVVTKRTRSGIQVG